MGTNGMRRLGRLDEPWRGIALVAALVGWLFALLLYGRNVLIWLVTGVCLVALLLGLVVLVRANRSLKWACNGLCARFLLQAARRLV